MSKDYRPSADRFAGGAENRVSNIIKVLEYVDDETPSRKRLSEWLENHQDIEINTEDTFNKHIGFIEQIGLLEENENYELGRRGEEALTALESDGQDIRDVLFDGLTMRVHGFSFLLERLQQGPIDFDDRATTLDDAYDGFFTPPGEEPYSPPDDVAKKHYTWLQAIDYIELDSGQYKLTEAGQNQAESESPERRSLAGRNSAPLRKRSQKPREDTEQKGEEEINYVADLDYLRDRSQAHEQVLDELEERLEESGYDCYQTNHCDLLALSDEKVILVEAKTVTPDTALKQIRQAIGQLHEYEYYDVVEEGIAEERELIRCLLLNEPPKGKLREYLEYLQTSDIGVLWWTGEEITGPTQWLLEDSR